MKLQSQTINNVRLQNFQTICTFSCTFTENNNEKNAKLFAYIYIYIPCTLGNASTNKGIMLAFLTQVYVKSR